MSTSAAATRERKRRNSAAFRERHRERLVAESRAHYQLNRDVYRAKLRARREERYEILNGIKLERGCASCGYRDHAVALDFHHRDPDQKAIPLAYAVDYSLERMLAEVEKCDVLCANCHRVLHVSGTH
jgi:hypothetical protein